MKDNLDIQEVHVCAFHQQYVKKMDDVCDRLRKIEIDKASEDSVTNKTASKLEEVIARVRSLEIAKAAEDISMRNLAQTVGDLAKAVQNLSEQFRKDFNNMLWKFIAGLGTLLLVFLTILYELIKSSN